jgi:hypothetical protein
VIVLPTLVISTVHRCSWWLMMLVIAIAGGDGR